MFLDEARLAMRLNHPNICHIYDLGELEGTYFIAMEWVNGIPFGKAIHKARDRGGIPVSVAIKVLSQVADALNYAHQARDGVGRPLNIVHRDVSPQNVMVRFDGVVKLLDFGIAKAATQTSQTEAGIVKGKFSYMSPEQCLGKPLDARSDIFALGACLYEALAAKPAFRRGTDLDTMRAIVHEPSPSVALARTDVPPRLDAIVRKALAKDPAQRYQTAGEMYVALERFLAEQGEFVHSMHIAQFLERVMPDAQASGPFAPESSPSGRAYKLGSGSRPAQRPVADLGAPTDQATVDKHLEPHAPIDLPSVSTEVDIEVQAPVPEDDVATEQWSGEDLPSVVQRLQAEAVAKRKAAAEHATFEVAEAQTALLVDGQPKYVAPSLDDPFAIPAKIEKPPPRAGLAMRAGIVVGALVVAALVTMGVVWVTTGGEEPAPGEATATSGEAPDPEEATEPGDVAPLPSLTTVGTVRVTSVPIGATVRLGSREGTTPISWNDVPPGEHTVRFTMEGREPVDVAVTVVAGEVAPVTAQLPVTEVGPAEVEPPEEIETPTPPIASPMVRPTRTPTPRATRTAPTGEIQIGSEPSGARVYHGSRLLGRTPLTTRLPAGTIRLRFVTPSGDTVMRSVQVRPGDSTRAFLPLGGG
jgi:serine/threonine-protein kinase